MYTWCYLLLINVKIWCNLHFLRMYIYLWSTNTSFALFQGPFVGNSFLAKGRFQLENLSHMWSWARSGHLWSVSFWLQSKIMNGIVMQVFNQFGSLIPAPPWSHDPPANPGDQIIHTLVIYMKKLTAICLSSTEYCIDYGLFYIT